MFWENYNINFKKVRQANLFLFELNVIPVTRKVGDISFQHAFERILY
jgi:hypothetical protein